MSEEKFTEKALEEANKIILYYKKEKQIDMNALAFKWALNWLLDCAQEYFVLKNKSFSKEIRNILDDIADEDAYYCGKIDQITSQIIDKIKSIVPKEMDKDYDDATYIGFNKCRQLILRKLEK